MRNQKLQEEVTKVEGGYDYHLISADGKAQGSVSFRAVEGDARIAARMTVAEGTDLKKVKEFEFISRDLYLHAFDKTNGSHVMVYNSDYYGNLYWNDMSEYYPKSANQEFSEIN